MAASEEDFRQIALSLAGVEERQHMGHPDFRVGGKIFATLESPDDGWGMVRIEPEEQATLVANHPDVFVPAKGAWGAQGCTHVRLDRVPKAALRRAIEAAWRLRAETQPKPSKRTNSVRPSRRRVNPG
jgi:hypothetical protein